MRCWVPELAAVSDEWIFMPWAMPATLRHRLGLVGAADYPAPWSTSSKSTAASRPKSPRPAWACRRLLGSTNGPAKLHAVGALPSSRWTPSRPRRLVSSNFTMTQKVRPTPPFMKFTSRTLPFLIEAGQQTDPNWLEENHAAYEAHVRGPFIDLAERLKTALQPIVPDYHFPVKGIGRIKKDRQPCGQWRPFL